MIPMLPFSFLWFTVLPVTVLELLLMMHVMYVWKHCGKKTETNDFLLKGISVLLPCFWLLLVLSWLPCWPYKGKGPFSINQLVKSQKIVCSAGIDVVIWCGVSEMFTWGHYLSILLELVTWKDVSINTCFPSPRCIWNTFIQVIVLITPYLRWCISDDCKLSGVLPLWYTVGNGVSTCSRLIMNWISHGYMLYILWMSADFCPEFNLGMSQGEVSFLAPIISLWRAKKDTSFWDIAICRFYKLHKKLRVKALSLSIFLSFWWCYFENFDEQ
jgi:hypothetical protein